MGLAVEVVTDSARLRELSGPWTDLWDRVPRAGLFQSAEYCLDAWESVARPAGERLACLVGWRDDRLVAVWPFVVSRSLVWTYARPLGASGVELHELLVDDDVDDAEWLQQAWRALRTEVGVDVVDVSFSEHSPHATALRALPALAADTGEDVCVSVDLRSEPDWDAYYGSLSKSSRKDFAKSRRRLEAQGALELSVVPAGDERIGPLLDWMLAQKRRWAERTGKKGAWLYSERYRAFLEQQLARPAASAENLVLTLTVGGDLLAVQVAAVAKQRYEAVIAGFDADQEKHSPGARMNEAMIRWAWERGLDCELGMGAEPYKLFWSRGRKSTVVHRRAAISRNGAVAFALRRLRDRLAARRG